MRLRDSNPGYNDNFRKKVKKTVNDLNHPILYQQDMDLNELGDRVTASYHQH